MRRHTCGDAGAGADAQAADGDGEGGGGGREAPLARAEGARPPRLIPQARLPQEHRLRGV